MNTKNGETLMPGDVIRAQYGFRLILDNHCVGEQANYTCVWPKNDEILMYIGKRKCTCDHRKRLGYVQDVNVLLYNGMIVIEHEEVNEPWAIKIV